jgi:trehalose 6-phosphate synthase
MPVSLTHDGESWTAQPSGGGLVQALHPVLRKRGGIWMGWPGVTDTAPEGWREAVDRVAEDRGYRFIPVALTDDLVRDFYGGFSNAVLWPLFHTLDERCVFEPAYWRAFLEANERFAEAVRSHCHPGDFIWVHDYQLISVAAQLRKRGVDARIGFFLHIPFPPADSFLKLPWRAEVLGALLEYDVVGFQSERDRRNFIDCVRRLMPSIELEDDESSGALTEIRSADSSTVTRVGTFPIGIDFDGVVEQGSAPDVAERAARLVDEIGCPVILGVDRLDYTKGVPERLLAFQHLLETTPELREGVVLLQVLSPSRELVPEYVELKQQIDGLIGAINGRFGTAAWVPIHYIYRPIGWPELFALYRMARVALVTPLRDGMNLVAKEYCACQLDEPGALVLSEFAGAAAQLHDNALVVNPHDIEGTSRATLEALGMTVEERRKRMSSLRRAIAREDVFWWARRFLRAVEGKELTHRAEFTPDLTSEAIERKAESGAPEDEGSRSIEEVSRRGTLTSSN